MQCISSIFFFNSQTAVKISNTFAITHPSFMALHFVISRSITHMTFTSIFTTFSCITTIIYLSIHVDICFSWFIVWIGRICNRPLRHFDGIKKIVAYHLVLEICDFCLAVNIMKTKQQNLRALINKNVTTTLRKYPAYAGLVTCILGTNPR